ncbi:MAG TPA: helix-turn-helix transcriptional regulator [Conexibacter sp.]|nr:helix-turn-helix transcriptional regulator [Conexibacter sp.]
MTRIGSHAFGCAVRMLRARERLTQKKLAARARIKAQHISDIELGRINPTLATIESLADGLALPASALLSEAERWCGASKR